MHMNITYSIFIYICTYTKIYIYKIDEQINMQINSNNEKTAISKGIQHTPNEQHLKPDLDNVSFQIFCNMVKLLLAFGGIGKSAKVVLISMWKINGGQFGVDG